MLAPQSARFGGDIDDLDLEAIRARTPGVDSMVSGDYAGPTLAEARSAGLRARVARRFAPWLGSDHRKRLQLWSGSLRLVKQVAS